MTMTRSFEGFGTAAMLAATLLVGTFTSTAHADAFIATSAIDECCGNRNPGAESMVCTQTVKTACCTGNALTPMPDGSLPAACNTAVKQVLVAARREIDAKTPGATVPAATPAPSGRVNGFDDEMDVAVDSEARSKAARAERIAARAREDAGGAKAFARRSARAAEHAADDAQLAAENAEAAASAAREGDECDDCGRSRQVAANQDAITRALRAAGGYDILPGTVNVVRGGGAEQRTESPPTLAFTGFGAGNGDGAPNGELPGRLGAVRLRIVDSNGIRNLETGPAALLVPGSADLLKPIGRSWCARNTGACVALSILVPIIATSAAITIGVVGDQQGWFRGPDQNITLVVR
ncbi:MAG: hypothetical protein Q7K39_04195 [Candidatus Magasanikbacteria bacterium]|nr:hypothetical protein [Candidatus Magasanikbacteria bacterium]